MEQDQTWRGMLRTLHDKGWRGYGFVGFLVACIGIAIFIPRQSARDRLLAITPGEMPACDSPPTRHLLFEAVKGSPAARTRGLVMNKVGGVRDAFPGVAEYEGQRTCIADLYTNAGRQSVTAVLTWTSTDKDEVFLSIPGMY